MDIVENQHYHRLLLMYKGLLNPDEVIKDARAQGPLAVATVGYGVGNWYLYNDSVEKAVEMYNEILDTGGWAGSAISPRRPTSSGLVYHRNRSHQFHIYNAIKPTVRLDLNDSRMV